MVLRILDVEMHGVSNGETKENRDTNRRDQRIRMQMGETEVGMDANGGNQKIRMKRGGDQGKYDAKRCRGF